MFIHNSGISCAFSNFLLPFNNLNILEECCTQKEVGGYTYTFIEEYGVANNFGCINDCVYVRDDLGPKRHFCFAPG